MSFRGCAQPCQHTLTCACQRAVAATYAICRCNICNIPHQHQVGQDAAADGDAVLRDTMVAACTDLEGAIDTFAGATAALKAEPKSEGASTTLIDGVRTVTFSSLEDIDGATPLSNAGGTNHPISPLSRSHSAMKCMLTCAISGGSQ